MVWEYVRIIVSVIVAFGLVILFHELGHFIMGKVAGVGIPAFSFGMGPELFGIDWRGTRYKVCLFPIGGYVKMIGEDDDTEEGVDPTKSMRTKHPLMKIGIFFAGPFMNFVLAIILFTISYSVWGVLRYLPEWVREKPSSSVVVQFVDVRKEAGRVGIIPGDVLVKVDGKPIRRVDEVTKVLWKSPGHPVDLLIDRDGRFRDIKVTPRLNKKTGQGLIGVVLGAPLPREVRSVAAGSPAAKAGLRPGDFLLDIDGRDLQGDRFRMTRDTATVFRAVKSGPSKHIVLAGASGMDSGLFLYPRLQRLGMGTAISLGAQSGVEAVRHILISFVWVAQRKVSSDDMAGPVGIMQYMADFARRDLKDFIDFVSLISVTLCLVNLIPIPALDGSRIVFSLWEFVSRRPLDPRRENLVHYVGFILLIGLILLVTYNDLLQLVRR